MKHSTYYMPGLRGAAQVMGPGRPNRGVHGALCLRAGGCAGDGAEGGCHGLRCVSSASAQAAQAD
ncbi:MAG: hypothetical protein ACYDGY_04890 [Acidimicrobiales bacterium]